MDNRTPHKHKFRTKNTIVTIEEILKKKIKNFDKNYLFNILKNVYQVFLFYKNFFKTKYFLLMSNRKSNYQNIYYFDKLKNDLSILCEKYGSDKGYVNLENNTPQGWKAHTYTNIYYNLFNHFKKEIKLLFECGIGTNNQKIISNMSVNGKPGASLRVWREYFTNSLIYGADIDKNILFEEDRIKTFYVDQLNQSSIKEMWSNINKDNFDIIIDDGLHTLEGSVTLFLNSFDKLRKNGIYIIEDVHLDYINKLSKELKSYDPEIIFLNDKNVKRLDNNLILIRKD